MAQKRMFDKRITDSDRFIDLPNSTKALYFMAGMNADDRGFFQPRRLQKECGFTDDDYKILIAKKFFITFDSGVMVITDWNKNNYLDNNRLTETEYIDELKMLQVINGKYELTQETLMLNDRLTDVKPTFNQNSIEKNNIYEQKNSDELSKDEKLEHNFGVLWNEYPRKKGKAQAFKHYKGIVRANKLSNQQMLSAIRRYKEYLEEQKIQDQYIMHGSTFFCSGIYDYLGDDKDD